MKLALKIDVDTYHGTLDGVPQLLRLLERHKTRATFLFSLGPDHTGRAIRRVFRRGFFGKVRRTSVIKHYGVKTLLYGTVLPGPDIGRRGADVMRATRDAGKVASSLSRLEAAARGDANMVPLLIEAVENYVTLGEICRSLRGVWGEQREATAL